MPDYHTMYTKLFSAQADAIDELRAITDKLVRSHQAVEEMLMDAPEPEIRLKKPDEQND